MFHALILAVATAAPSAALKKAAASVIACHNLIPRTSDGPQPPNDVVVAVCGLAANEVEAVFGETSDAATLDKFHYIAAWTYMETAVGQYNLHDRPAMEASLTKAMVDCEFVLRNPSAEPRVIKDCRSVEQSVTEIRAYIGEANVPA
jgi:hypothetical protein